MRLVGLRHQLADILAYGLPFGIAKQPLGGSAEKLDDAVTVNDDHGIRYGIENRAEVAFSDF